MTDKERLRNEFSQAFYRSIEEGKIEITALPAAQLGERMANIGDVILLTSSLEHPEVRLENVKDPAQVRELIRVRTKTKRPYGSRET